MRKIEVGINIAFPVDDDIVEFVFTRGEAEQLYEALAEALGYEPYCTCEVGEPLLGALEGTEVVR